MEKILKPIDYLVFFEIVEKYGTEDVFRSLEKDKMSPFNEYILTDNYKKFISTINIKDINIYKDNMRKLIELGVGSIEYTKYPERVCNYNCFDVTTKEGKVEGISQIFSDVEVAYDEDSFHKKGNTANITYFWPHVPHFKGVKWVLIARNEYINGVQNNMRSAFYTNYFAFDSEKLPSKRNINSCEIAKGLDKLLKKM